MVTEQETRSVKFADLFWTILLAFAGLIGVGVFGYRIVIDSSSRTWPTTQGTVTESALSTTYNSEGEPVHEVNVAYEYLVAGQTYRSDRISSMRTIRRSNRQAAEDVLLSYQPGREVTVSYHPRNPQQAVLETGVRRGWWFGVALSVAWTAGWGVYFVRIKKRSRLERDAATDASHDAQ